MRKLMDRLAKVGALGGALVVTGVVGASSAFACGGLVGENGTIQLVRTSTLAAYHDGVERYVTSFAFTGEGAEVGSIVPLPGVPTAVERGGDWTLQRLAQEVAPPPRSSEGDAGASAATSAAGARVLLEVEVDALDITILEGGGDAVGDWAVEHGYFLTPDAPEVLDFYAARSPIFMAARFDATRTRDLGQTSGDGTPIMLTIPTERPWVPLRILALGSQPGDLIEADVFLLTDSEPELLAGGRGLTLERSRQAGRGLLDDLRSDEGMEWLPERSWLSYLRVEADAADLTYDLAVSTDRDVAPSIVDAGVARSEATVLEPTGGGDGWRWPILGAVAASVVAVLARRALRSPDPRPGGWT